MTDQSDPVVAPVEPRLVAERTRLAKRVARAYGVPWWVAIPELPRPRLWRRLLWRLTGR